MPPRTAGWGVCLGWPCVDGMVQPNVQEPLLPASKSATLAVETLSRTLPHPFANSNVAVGPLSVAWLGNPEAKEREVVHVKRNSIRLRSSSIYRSHANHRNLSPETIGTSAQKKFNGALTRAHVFTCQDPGMTQRCGGASCILGTTGRGKHLDAQIRPDVLSRSI